MTPEQTPRAASRRRSTVDRFLDVVERIGNALPDPTTLFALRSDPTPICAVTTSSR